MDCRAVANCRFFPVRFCRLSVFWNKIVAAVFCNFGATDVACRQEPLQGLKDQIYRELVYGDDAFVLDEVTVELRKGLLRSVNLIHVDGDRRKGLFTCNSWGMSDMNSQCYLNPSEQRLLYSMEEEH